MTLFLGIILAAVLIVLSLYLIKNSASRKVAGTAVRPVAPPSPNPGSIPDGTTDHKSGGHSAMSSGKQG